MRLGKIIETATAAGAIALLAACQSATPVVSSPTTSNAAPAAGIAAIPPQRGVEFDPAAGTVVSVNSSASVAGPSSGPNAGAAPVDRGVRPLALYGQLPDQGPQRQSPLDSPDNLVRVTFADEGADFDPAVDPTGQWIVYASTQHRPTADLYLKRVGGTTITQLTNDPGNDVMPVFSPDGQRVAFASDRSGRWAIYVMDVQGGQPIQITNDPNDNIHPSFSRDGARLAYCSHGGQSGQWEIVVVNLENPAAKHFVSHGLFPSFSPVDDRILFQRARERGTRWFSVWTVDLINNEGMRPTEIAASANAALITPAWSPDGKHIAFCSVIDPSPDDRARPTQSDIWIVAADGTSRANLTHSPYANLQPVWSKDGTIYFTSNRGKDGTENVWGVRPDRPIALGRRSETRTPGVGTGPGTPAASPAPHAVPSPLRPTAKPAPTPAHSAAPEAPAEATSSHAAPAASAHGAEASAPHHEPAALVNTD